jgi:hypothetical protein
MRGRAFAEVQQPIACAVTQETAGTFVVEFRQRPCHATTLVTQKDTSYPQERRSAYATRSYGPSRHHHQNAIVSQTS